MPPGAGPERQGRGLRRAWRGAGWGSREWGTGKGGSGMRNRERGVGKGVLGLGGRGGGTRDEIPRRRHGKQLWEAVSGWDSGTEGNTSRRYREGLCAPAPRAMPAPQSPVHGATPPASLPAPVAFPGGIPALFQLSRLPGERQSRCTAGPPPGGAALPGGPWGGPGRGAGPGGPGPAQGRCRGRGGAARPGGAAVPGGGSASGAVPAGGGGSTDRLRPGHVGARRPRGR